MSGIAWGEISPEERARVESCFPADISVIRDLVRYDNGFVMPRHFALDLEHRIREFGLREDDIWIVTYPKCGTHWTQELVWMLLHDVDIEAGKVPLSIRSPMVEGKAVINKEIVNIPGDADNDQAKVFDDPIEFLDNMKGRRVIKTHLPLEFLPPKILDTCKVVYVARNPKDVAVSFYHHNLIVPGHGFVGNFEQFMQFFEEGLHVFGSYWHHVRGGWHQRNHRNLKFVWFEDMKRDQKAVIEELCDFLQHPLTEDLVDRLCDHVKFENLKKNPYVNPSASNEFPSKDKKNFMRKGEVGDWKNYFDNERNQKWKQWIEENTRGTGLENVEHITHLF